MGSVTPVRLPKNRKAPALINKTGAYILCLYHSLNQHTFICAPVTAEIPAQLNGIRVQPRGSEVIFDPCYSPPVSHRHRLALRFCAELLSSSMPLKIIMRNIRVFTSIIILQQYTIVKRFWLKILISLRKDRLRISRPLWGNSKFKIENSKLSAAAQPGFVTVPMADRCRSAQLSIFNFQLSIINYQLSIINLPLFPQTALVKEFHGSHS